MLQLEFPKIKSLFHNTRTIEVSGEGGPFLNFLGKGLLLEDFTFGDAILFDTPHELTLRKEENNLQFSHTFPGSSLGAIWVNYTGGGTGAATISNNLLTLTAPGAGDDAAVGHKIFLTQSVFGNIVFETRVRRTADSGAPGCFMGLSVEDPLDTSTNYAYFRLITNNTTWLPAVRKSGAISNGTPFTYPDGEPINLKIVLSTNRADFYANDKLVETITGANVPDTVPLAASFGIHESGGDTVALEIGWCKVEYGNLAPLP